MSGSEEHGLVVRAVACEANCGFDSSSDQMVFHSLLGHRRKEKMDPDTIKCVILRILVEKKDNS